MKSNPAGFYKHLVHNHEDISLIRSTEKMIRSLRKDMFRLPKDGGSVVLLLSGGLDSVIAWEMLLGQYHLHVYPLVVSQGLLDPQYGAIRKFCRIFRKKYADRYHEPYGVRAPASHGNFHTKILNDAPPERLLQYFDLTNQTVKVPFWGANVFTAYWGYMYLQYLTFTLPCPVNTIIYGATADDGLFIPSQTYAFMRLTMLMLMKFSANPAVQFGSVFYEESLHTFMTKADVLLYGHRALLPLSKTYSCDKRGIFHCGTCLSCRSRRYCFDRAGVIDQTLYTDGESIKEWLKQVWQRTATPIKPGI